MKREDGMCELPVLTLSCRFQGSQLCENVTAYLLPHCLLVPELLHRANLLGVFNYLLQQNGCFCKQI